MVLPKLLDESDVLERACHTWVSFVNFLGFIRVIRKFALRVSDFGKAMMSGLLCLRLAITSIKHTV
jgi:hypothetical protein